MCTPCPLGRDRPETALAFFAELNYEDGTLSGCVVAMGVHDK